MAIIKQAKNIYSQIKEEYVIVTKNFVETSETLIADSTEENLSLNSNKKIVMKGNSG